MARAQVRGAIRPEEWYGTRRVTLTDNMSCVLALRRSRARSFRLLLLVRRACAIGLPFHCRQYFRWIPSEGNPADAPSCVYHRGKFGNKSTALFQYPNFRVNTGQKLHNESDQSIVSAHQSCISTTSVAPSCPKPPVVCLASLRRHERVSARRLNETELSPQSSDSRIRNSGGRIEKEEKENGSKVDAFSKEQDESSSDEKAAEDDDTSSGRAEWKDSRKLFHTERQTSVQENLRPSPGQTWGRQGPLSLSRAASCPWTLRLWSHSSRGRLKNIPLRCNIEQASD